MSNLECYVVRQVDLVSSFLSRRYPLIIAVFFPLHRSEVPPAVECLLNAALTPWLRSTRLPTVCCSSTMIDVPTQPVPRRLPKWYDSSHLDCILCQQEPCTGSATDCRTAAVCPVVAEPRGSPSHGKQLCVQRGQWRGGGSGASEAAQAGGELWTSRGQGQSAPGPCPTAQARPGPSRATPEKAERRRSGAGYACCYQDSCWQVSVFFSSFTTESENVLRSLTLWNLKYGLTLAMSCAVSAAADKVSVGGMIKSCDAKKRRKKVLFCKDYLASILRLAVYDIT